MRDGKRKQRPFDFEKHTFTPIAVRVAYVGTQYHGLARQTTTDETIETQLILALEKTKLIRDVASCRWSRCGRTDKGVHAAGNVFCLDARVIQGDYAHVLNRVLPVDIRITAWAHNPERHHARFDCSQRTYKYAFFRDQLDLDAMQEAAAYLEGEHDFRNYCRVEASNCDGSFVRRILSIRIEELPIENMMTFTITGWAFLYNQIRCMVAILFLVGRGKEEPTIAKDLLDLDQFPSRPNYVLADERPLVLYDCAFTRLQWKEATDPTAIQTVQCELEEQKRAATMKSAIYSILQESTQHIITPQTHIFQQTRVPHLFDTKYVAVHKRPRGKTVEEVRARAHSPHTSECARSAPHDGERGA